MNEENNKQKSYVCTSCGSKSIENPGICCGAERKPEVKKCKMCNHEHKNEGTCDCGCK